MFKCRKHLYNSSTIVEINLSVTTTHVYIEGGRQGGREGGREAGRQAVRERGGNG